MIKYFVFTLLQIYSVLFIVPPVPAVFLTEMFDAFTGNQYQLNWIPVILWLLLFAVLIVKQSSVLCSFSEKFLSKYTACSVAGLIITTVAVAVFFTADSNDGKLIYSPYMRFLYMPPFILLLYPAKNENRIPQYLKKTASVSFFVFISLTAAFMAGTVYL